MGNLGKVGFSLRGLIVVVLVAAFLYALPNVLTPSQRAALPSWLPNQAMPLGLDLQGGAHLLLEIDLPGALAQSYLNVEDSVRQIARDNNVRYANLRAGKDGVTLTLPEPAQADTLRNELGAEFEVQVGADGETQVAYTDAAKKQLASRALSQTLNVLRNRVDQFGVAEPTIMQQGSTRVIVELPGVRDVARAKAAIGKTAQLTFHMVDETADVLGPVPSNRLKLEEVRTDATGKVVGRSALIVNKRPDLTGELLTNASAAFDQFGGAAVDIAFNGRGTKIFADLSTKHVGQRFAIVLDGKVYSAPVFREPILGGRAQISGSFTSEEAHDLAAILSAGALPAALSVVEERTVGPSLGSDSIRAGILAMITGFIAVLIFMVVFYGFFGLVANVTLFVNLLIVVAIMSAVGFTLTLPGLAGLVLTLGMSIDANVLIYERMREEMAAGKKPLAVIVQGFGGAYSAILDSNITVVIAAVVLFALGTGTVKGFAISLILGVVASMFTAVTLTRWVLLSWLNVAKPKVIPL